MSEQRLQVFRDAAAMYRKRSDFGTMAEHLHRVLAEQNRDGALSHRRSRHSADHPPTFPNRLLLHERRKLPANGCRRLRQACRGPGSATATS